MNIVELAKAGMEIIQQVEPGVKSAAEVTTSLATIGTAVVKVLQKGKTLYTYFIGKRKDEETEEPGSVEIMPKADVAVLVDINRRMLQDVANYLDGQGIDANLVIVTNDPAYSDKVRFLDAQAPDEWEELVQDFNSAIGIIKHAVGNARLHFFLSTPLALAFGLGSVWGTVDEATVYHWEEDTYQPSMKISRWLRQ